MLTNGNMKLFIDSSPADCLHCTVSGNFTPEKGVRIIEQILTEAVRTGCFNVLINITPINHPADATSKLIWAYDTREKIAFFFEATGRIPKIAIHGTPPLVISYKPETEYFIFADIPVRVFDCREDALAWLDQPDRPLSPCASADTTSTGTTAPA